MFTGIVRDVGRVVSFDGFRLVVETSVEAALGRLRRGGRNLPHRSRVQDGRLVFDVVPETLGRVKPFGGEVNVEPPLRAGDPLGGHYVQGHVDATGRVQSVEAEGDGLRVLVHAPPDVLRYCVEKGSVAVDGVALTVAEVSEDDVRRRTRAAHACVHHLVDARARSRSQPRSRHTREVRGAPRAVGRLMLPPGEAGLRMRLTTLAARSCGLAACPYCSYCPARRALVSLASAAPTARGNRRATIPE